MEKVDITIIGAGVIGLATAALLSNPERTVVILEKNAQHGQESSSRNSEVIHAGIYYHPESLKARLCIRGKTLLYEYCARHCVPVKTPGKIITVCEKRELPDLEALYKRGISNGLNDLEMLGRRMIKRLEPNIHALAGILSPSTGILSADILMEKYLKEASSKGAMIFTRCQATGITKTNDGYKIRTNSQEPFFSRIVINASGHSATQIAQMPGIDPDEAGYRQIFIKGEYFRIRSAPKVTRLIYPLPEDLSLGIHLTPDLSGGLRLGPSSFEVDEIDYNVDVKNRPLFVESAKRYFPDITEDVLDADTSGIRARLAKFSGEHPDFIINHEEKRGFAGFVNLLGMDSPGLTASPAIAEHIRELIKELL